MGRLCVIRYQILPMFTNLGFEDAPQVYTLRKRTGGDIVDVATELSA